MKLLLKDFGLCILFSFVYSYAFYVFWYGAAYDKLLIPVVDALYFGVICFAIYALSVRILKSHVLFFVISWAVSFLLFFLNVDAARRGGLHQNINGYDIFVSGDITLFGVFHEIFDPVGLMAIWASFIYFRYLKSVCRIENIKNK